MAYMNDVYNVLREAARIISATYNSIELPSESLTNEVFEISQKIDYLLKEYDAIQIAAVARN